MVGENKKLCPYDTVVPFECDLMYRDGELYRQLQRALSSGRESFVYLRSGAECDCDPEICSRYVQHLIANLDKYKKVNNGR